VDKKKKRWGKNEFLPTCSAPKAPVEMGSGSSLRQQGGKARKNCFLNCPPVGGPRTLSKRKRNFCGLC